jgi:hypothetical protein
VLSRRRLCSIPALILASPKLCTGIWFGAIPPRGQPHGPIAEDAHLNSGPTESSLLDCHRVTLPSSGYR